MKRTVWVLAFLSIAAVPVACGFPDVKYLDGLGGGGGSASSQHSGSGSTGSSGPVGGGGTSSMTTGSASGGAGGAGGSGGTSSSSSGGGQGGGEPCPTADDPCDCDNDGHRRLGCPGNDNSKPVDDCADHDPRAFKGQTMFYDTKIVGPVEGSTPDFDFDCDGGEKFEWTGKVKCSLITLCSTSGYWIGATPTCGMPGTAGDCGTDCSPTDEGTRKQACR